MEITKVNNTLTSNTEEIYRLRNHNKILVMKIKKLKSTKKADKSNEFIEGKVVGKKEESQCFLNINKELKEQLKKRKDEEKMQEEIIKKIQSENKQLENKLKGIHNKTSKLIEMQFLKKTDLPTQFKSSLQMSLQ